MIAVSAVLAACSADPVSVSADLSPRFAVGDVANSTAEFGKIKLCKAGNTSGSFTVTRRVAGASSGTVLAGVTLQPGECKVVAEDFSASGSGSFVTITETPSTNLTGITGTRIDANPTRTSNVSNPQNGAENFLNSFHGFAFTYTNTVAVTRGCTFTQGFYKNKGADRLPARNFFLSGQTYLQVLDAPSKGGNPYYILAQQYIAASQNVSGGASSTPAVTAALADAAAYFAVATPANPLPGSYTKDQLTALATTLDDYNNGRTGPGHCD